MSSASFKMWNQSGVLYVPSCETIDSGFHDKGKDPPSSASYSARENPQLIPANTPPVFPGLRLESGRTSFASSRMVMPDRLITSHHDGRAIFSLATHFFVPVISPRLPLLI